MWQNWLIRSPIVIWIPFYQHGLTSIPARIFNDVPRKEYDEMILSIIDLQRYRWNSVMDQLFHLTFHTCYDYLYRLKLIYFNKSGPWSPHYLTISIPIIYHTI